jgi:addiction module HigA family antidote
VSKPRIAPVHPGVYLRELLEELGISQYRLAHDIGVPAMRIGHVVHGRRPVTAELALRLGRYLGQSPRYWVNLQSRYDIDVAEEVFGNRVAREVRPSKAVATGNGGLTQFRRSQAATTAILSQLPSES